MAAAIINFMTEPQTKREAQKVAKKLGIPLSLVLNNYLKHFIQTKAVIFSEEPSEYLIAAIKRSREQLKKGQVSPKFSDSTKIINYLHQQLDGDSSK